MRERCVHRGRGRLVVTGANPAIREPTEKITSALCTRVFLLNMSANLPQMGVVAVIASIVATTTQV